MTTETANHWVFGYGSLMWNPGFPHLRAVAARINGYHRRLCVYSFHYRGQPGKPGLVFGLDRGGSCSGLAFEVAAGDWPSTLQYLRKRELVSTVYREASKPVRIGAADGIVEAVTYVVDRNHPQYARKIEEAEIVRLVRQGRGEAGDNLDYVHSTHRHLEELGIPDAMLAKLIRRLG